MSELKILHLEDFLPDAEFVDRALRKGGFHFEKMVVDNRDEFVSAIDIFKPNVILSDHTLPAFNSLEALKITQERELDIPFILITATISEEFAVEVMKAGAWDYILKDHLQRLPSALSAALERYNLDKEKKDYLEKIVAREAMMKEAEDMAHFGSFNWDLSNGKIEWSDEMYRMFGFSPGEIEPSLTKVLSYVEQEDHHKIQEDYSLLQKSIKPDKRIIKIKNKQDFIRYLLLEYNIKEDERERKVYGFAQDITETKLAQESLEKSSANLRTIFDHADTAYLLLDTEFRVISFNNLAADFAANIMHVQLEEGGFALTYLRKHRQDFVSTVLDRIRAGETVRYETSYPTDGKEEWFEVIWTKVLSADKIIGFIFSAKNITERKMAELEREKIISDITARNNALEQFTYIVSHNLRAPVANIKGLALVLAELNLSGDDRFLLDSLTLSIDRVDEVIRDLNEILQVKNRIVENPEIVFLPLLLEEVKSFLRTHKEDEDFFVEADFRSMTSIRTVKSYMFSIFYNLISNSIKYRKEETAPRIIIKTEVEDGEVKFLFKDNGRGIDLKKNGSMLFGLYRRFDSSVEGKGMGLFMVKTQVEALGGNIQVNSEPGESCEFKITLPQYRF